MPHVMIIFMNILLVFFLFEQNEISAKIIPRRDFSNRHRRHNNQINFIDLSQDVTGFQTLEQSRLEYDENLLEEQQRIENLDTPIEFIMEEHSNFTTNKEITIPQETFNYRKNAKIIFRIIWDQILYIFDQHRDKLYFICYGCCISVGALILVCIVIKSNANEIKPRKKRKFKYLGDDLNQLEEEPILTQSILQDNSRTQANSQYSILNSNTESSTFSQRVNHSTHSANKKYRMTEYMPEIRDPFQESFVKRSLKVSRSVNLSQNQNDSSLLEIDELLKEMNQI